MFRIVNVVVALTLSALAVVLPQTRPHTATHVGLSPAAVRVAEFAAGDRSDIVAAVNVQAQADEAAANAKREQDAAAAAAAQAAAAQAAAAATSRTAVRTGTTGPAPAPAPAAGPASYPAGSIQQIIHDAFAPYGQAAIDWGERVAKCESGYNPRAYNPAGPYYGLFQFLMSTFKATPYGNQDIYDPVANAKAAAWKYSQGGQSAWGCN